MAIVAGTQTGGKRPGSSKPVSAHPLFSAYVAFWFASLLGLSSLAVGTPNLERAVSALQLQLLIPAAAPPLGTTARALIAAAMALLGTGIGLGVAGLFAPKKPAEPRAPFRWPTFTKPSFKRPQRAVEESPVTVRPRDIHPDAPVRRPIFAHEELGESGEFEDAEAVQDMEALRAARIVEPESVDLVLPSFLVAARTSAEPQERAETLPDWIEGEFVESLAAPQPIEATPVEAAPVEAPPLEATSVAAKPLPPAPFAMPPGEAAERIASADLTDLSPVELLERFAIALKRRQERAGVPLSAEQAARVQAIGEAALALGREALDELDGATKATTLEQPKRFAVVPPKAAPEMGRNSKDTEKALRDALAALQRMTGTA